MTGNEYQLKAMRTAGNPKLKDLLLNGVMGLNGESGECIDIVKKHLFQGHRLEELKLIEELGDVAWYLSACCTALGVCLDDVLEQNIEKLEKRYPHGFEAEKSIHRSV